MQRPEVSYAVRRIYTSLGVKALKLKKAYQSKGRWIFIRLLGVISQKRYFKRFGKTANTGYQNV